MEPLARSPLFRNLPPLLLLLLPLAGSGGRTVAARGSFWHITDLHWDPSYTVTDNPGLVCASTGTRPAPNAGRDDTPHVPNEQLGEEAVLSIVGNLTRLLQLAFPKTKVYSALGNHDYHPKSQMPPGQSTMYEQMAQLWQDWLEPESQRTFQSGGYYSEQLLNKTGYRVLVLNTNLYYDQNKLTENVADPAGQFEWMDNILTRAAQKNEKAYIVGHVPPGFFEKKRSKPWFRPDFNRRYLELVQKHHAVIYGQFFGHHHTDSFRMFYDLQGNPISTIFITPGVTPWKTTLPGVEDGANNPGIRVFNYDPSTLLVEDSVTYYLNLTYANAMRERWEKEYRLCEAFQVPDASPSSMHAVLERLAGTGCDLQKYYEFNSVSYDLSACDADCRVDHICAIREVDFERYEQCLLREGTAATPLAFIPLLIPTALTIYCAAL
ncbi:acid sphingomyelinase-like phosphodiesterase 3b isoform X2 [Scleropages formosus]|uniref:acid sphingomyelinase-like phosphodiesterase 3b isoform X2 n=1 Tax=Scleropages formosus TaxID=113540 RepID=UPI0010FA6557|nr:acid sphingomyelinase-like phosphodiesterase 3b isoform X2 [Scleropages formosus]